MDSGDASFVRIGGDRFIMTHAEMQKFGFSQGQEVDRQTIISICELRLAILELRVLRAKKAGVA